MTLQINKLELVQHAQSIKVKFTHLDLSHAFAEMILPLPIGADGTPLTGEALETALAEQAPPRDWFECQEQRLAGEAAFVVNMPPELQALAPIKALDRPLEWFEDACVGQPSVVEGQWVKPVLAVDLRDDANLPALKVRLIAKLADVRYGHETAGIVVNGSMFKTDRESRALINDAYKSAMADATTTVPWKTVSGFVTLDAEKIITARNAMFAYVQGCFAREQHFTELVDAAETVADLTGIDIAEGWSA